MSANLHLLVHAQCCAAVAADTASKQATSPSAAAKRVADEDLQSAAKRRQVRSCSRGLAYLFLAVPPC